MFHSNIRYTDSQLLEARNMLVLAFTSHHNNTHWNSSNTELVFIKHQQKKSQLAGSWVLICLLYNVIGIHKKTYIKEKFKKKIFQIAH